MAVAGSQIRVNLPSNTLLNLKSIKMLAGVTTTGSGVRLPAKIESLIDRVSLECGGQTIDGASMQQYGLLAHAKAVFEGNTTGPLSHPKMVRTKPYHTGGAAITGTNNEEVPAANEGFVFDFTHSFLGTCAPTVIDTSLVGDLCLVIQLHGNEVLSTVSGPTMTQFLADGTKAGTYTLQHIRFVCECIGLGSGV